MSGAKKSLIWLIVLGVIGFLVYFAGISIHYYGDDFLFLFDFSCSNFIHHFLRKNPNVGWYRPIEAAFLACVQDHFYLNTIPIHIATISLHTLLSYLIFVVLLKLGYSHIQAMLGSLFMLLSQANASAVLGNDTLSQVSGTFFGCLSLWLLRVSSPKSDAIEAGGRIISDYRKYSLSSLAFAIALLSKESSVSFFPLLLCIVLFNFTNFGKEKIPLRKTFITVLPFIAILFAYLATRSLLGVSHPGLGSGRYNFHFGMNLIENLLMLLFASIIPTSSVTAFTTFTNGQLSTFSAIAVVCLVFIGLLGYGLWYSRRYSIILTVGAFGFCALFPMVMMNHVSELYAYNFMPFVSMMAGVGFGTIFERSNTRWHKQAVAVMLLVLFVSHITAIQSKASLMEKNGAYATILLNGIQPYVQKVPADGELLLLNPYSHEPEYSEFVMSGFNVLKFGESRIKKTSNRDDITVRIIDQKDFEQFSHRSDALILLLDGNAIKVYREETDGSSASRSLRRQDSIYLALIQAG